MNLALPDHHEYFEPTNPRFFNDEIRIQLMMFDELFDLELRSSFFVWLSL